MADRIEEILNTEKMDTCLRRYDNTGYAGMLRARRYDPLALNS